MKDLAQDLELSSIKERLSALEARADQAVNLIRIVASIGGTALGIDLLPMLS